jgi:hypothetical protein
MKVRHNEQFSSAGNMGKERAASNKGWPLGCEHGRETMQVRAEVGVEVQECEHGPEGVER